MEFEKNKKYELTFEREGVEVTLVAEDIVVYQDGLISFSSFVPNIRKYARFMFPLNRLRKCKEVVE